MDSESWNACALPWNAVCNPAGNLQILLGLLDRRGRLSQRHTQREVEADRHRRELALVADRQRRHRLGRPFGEGAHRHQLAVVRRADVKLLQRLRVSLQRRGDLLDDVVGVDLREILRRPRAGRRRRRACRRSVAAECRSATPCRGRSSAAASCRKLAGRCRRRAIPADFATWRGCAAPRRSVRRNWRPASVYWNCVSAARAPTVTSCAACRKSRTPITLAAFCAQPLDHLERVDVTLFAGLERDEHAAVVLRGVAGAGAETHRHRGDGRIGLNDRGRPFPAACTSPGTKYPAPQRWCRR